MGSLDYIEFNIKAKNECWVKLISSMLITLGINMDKSFPQENVNFKLAYQDFLITYRIEAPKEKISLLEEYIRNYALVLIRKKPLSDIFNDSLEMMKFKQHLDLSALELKINRDIEDEESTGSQEIFSLHDYLGEELLRSVQYTS